MSEEKRYALVTGGSRGIGRAVCVELARKGYHVLINYTRGQEAAQVTLSEVRAVGGDGETIGFDVSDGEAVSRVLGGWRRRILASISVVWSTMRVCVRTICCRSCPRMIGTVC